MGELKLVYVAGPFSGGDSWTVAENVRNAERVGLDVARAGFFPVIPHANTHAFDRVSGVPDELWIEGTLELMRRCDAVVLVSGWERSKGTAGEIAEALLLKIPIYRSVDELMGGGDRERGRI